MTADDAMDIENMTSKKSPRVDDSESSFADIEKPGMTRAQDTESPKSNTGFDSMSSVHSENSMLKYVSRNSYRRAAGSSYVLAMAVSGLVLIALASSLEDLAKMVHRSSIEIGSVFISRGVGAGVGLALSSKLYGWIGGKIAVSVTLFLLAGALLSMPLNRSVLELHATFFAIGLLTSVINCGCQIMTCRLHGSAAGPWLGANTVAFGLSGAISPLIGFLTGSLIVQYSVLAAVTVVIAFFLVVLPRPERPAGLIENQFIILPLEIPQGLTRPISFYENYKIDFNLGGMMFWFMGARVSATAFLRQFANQTGSERSTNALLVVLFWMAITLGRLISLRDQRTLTLARLYRHLAFVSLMGAVAVLMHFVFLSHGVMLWTPFIVLGVFNGPALGYCFDLSTRVSPNPATSTAVTVFGLTLGASLLPFLVSAAWDMTGWSVLLPLFLIMSHTVAFYLVLDTRRLHSAVAGSRRAFGFSDDPSAHSAVLPTPTFGAPPSPMSVCGSIAYHCEEETKEEAAQRRATEGEGADIEGIEDGRRGAVGPGGEGDVEMEAPLPASASTSVCAKK